MKKDLDFCNRADHCRLLWRRNGCLWDWAKAWLPLFNNQ